MNKTITKSFYLVFSPIRIQGRLKHHSAKVLVVGGGAGGCSTAAKLSKYISKNELIIVDPSSKHYYQPLFTLVGGGISTLDQTYKEQKDVLPKDATWIQDSVQEFDPKNSSVNLANGDTIKYDFLLLALGLETNYEKIPGLVQALNTPNSGVGSNYSAKYVEKTFESLQNFESGNAIFTYPTGPVKCPGAPQKICYISEDYLRKHNKRDKAKLIYNTSLPVLFGVKKYADALWKICKARDIDVNLRTNLIEIKPESKEAVFENLDDPSVRKTLKYSMLHVTPPMSTPLPLRSNKELSDNAGFANVHPDTLQHVKYPNIFAIGDCSSSPNSKTAAAAAAQTNVVFQNMKSAMEGKKFNEIYDGYASCPLITGYNKCILAEFNYKLEPLETFPISQDKEMYSMYLLKKMFMPTLYWNLMMNGYWNGPSTMRKILNLNMK